MDCYYLAKQYSCDPDIFLNKPISAIYRIMHWTAKLIAETNPSQDDDAS